MKADMTVAEVIQTQGEVIRMQTKVIDKLYMLLSQHVDASELPVIDDIKKAAEKLARIGGDDAGVY